MTQSIIGKEFVVFNCDIDIHFEGAFEKPTIMRILIFILLLIFCNKGFSQEKAVFPNPFIPRIYVDSADKFELQYLQYSNKYYSDTLPYYGDSENRIWDKMQVVIYFPDTLNVRVIYFSDGNLGNYYFFFEGDYLAKARFYTQSNKNDKSYYYTIAENKIKYATTLTEIVKGIKTQNKSAILSAALGLKQRLKD